MVTKAGPYILEYNVRFGDPEAQVILPLLDGSWFDVFSKVADGQMPKLKWKKQAAVCVVIAAPGYPDNPQKGAKILIDKKLIKITDTNYLLHASTASHMGLYTNGGRVLNVIGIDKNVESARKKAYQLIKGISFPDMQYRKDIANSKE
jgi:phosphoribosylamine--glycine ligase